MAQLEREFLIVRLTSPLLFGKSNVINHAKYTADTCLVFYEGKNDYEAGGKEVNGGHEEMNRSTLMLRI